MTSDLRFVAAAKFEFVSININIYKTCEINGYVYNEKKTISK